jgi:hypothetical protein
MKKLILILMLGVLVAFTSSAQTTRLFNGYYRYAPAFSADSTNYATQNLWWYDGTSHKYRFSENGVKYSLKTYISTFLPSLNYWPLTGTGTLTGNTTIDTDGFDLTIGDADNSFNISNSFGGTHFESTGTLSFGGLASINGMEFNSASTWVSNSVSIDMTASQDATILAGTDLSLRGTGSVNVRTNNIERIKFDTDGSWDLASTPGSSGQLLTSQGASSAPIWTTVSAGTTETASNGLTKTVNDIKLGGALTGSTTITGGSNDLLIGTSGDRLGAIEFRGNNTMTFSMSSGAGEKFQALSDSEYTMSFFDNSTSTTSRLTMDLTGNNFTNKVILNGTSTKAGLNLPARSSVPSVNYVEGDMYFHGSHDAFEANDGVTTVGFFTAPTSQFTNGGIPYITSTTSSKATVSTNMTFNATGTNVLFAAGGLNSGGSFQAKSTALSANTTLNQTHFAVNVDATGASRTISLPSASASNVPNRMYVINKVDASANTVVIDPNASQLINGATTYTLTTQYESVLIQSDGTAWYILSKHMPAAAGSFWPLSGSASLTADTDISGSGHDLFIKSPSGNFGITDGFDYWDTMDLRIGSTGAVGSIDNYIGFDQTAGSITMTSQDGNTILMGTGGGNGFIAINTGDAGATVTTPDGSSIGVENDGDVILAGGNGSGGIAHFIGVTDTNGFTTDGGVTAGGTTGNRTINTIWGTVNFAAAATSITVTSNITTTASIIIPVKRTADATCNINNIVASNGSFVINMTAACTAETSVGFFIIN